jgi:hypothetical protein
MHVAVSRCLFEKPDVTAVQHVEATADKSLFLAHGFGSGDQDADS